ncbi:MAG: hypothetical protein GY828_00535 [Candidatus Gracilibacteria bacterium]|nr:hypothetical protein [Candidatus Gracilibacteria bacterium]
MGESKFIIDVTIIIITFLLLNKFKIKISKILLKIPGNIFIISLLTSIPFIFIEESINCIDWGDGLGCRMTGWINLILIIQVGIMLGFMRYFKIVSSNELPPLKCSGNKKEI